MSAPHLIPVQTISDLSNDQFIKAELPVVAKGACKDWPAYKKWGVEFFSDVYGDVKVPMSNYKEDPYQAANTKSELKIRDYLKSATKIAEGIRDENENLYSAGWFFCKGYCELLDDVVTPPVFEKNWADSVQKIIHFDTRSIIFGHPKVESPLHTDSFFVSTWIAAIRGQKRIRLIGPEYSKHVHNGFDAYCEKNLKKLKESSVPVYDAVIEEGDIIWFPPGWWHYVKNDTFTISLTTNFIHEFHFLPFEQQIRSTLIKPLLRLDQLKRECTDSVLHDTRMHSKKVLSDSNYLRNETAYLKHFSGVLGQTESLLERLG